MEWARASERMDRKRTTRSKPLSKKKANAVFKRACTTRRFDTAEHLLKEGKVSIDALGCDGKAALHKACENYDHVAVTFLLDHGANVDVPDEDGVTPLSVACLNNDKDLVIMLLAKGASVNPTPTKNCENTRYTEVPLVYAAMGPKRKKITKLLLEAGADPNQQISTGHTATTYLASARVDPVITRMLVDAGGDINWLGDEKESALAFAVRFGLRDTAKLLIDLGADVNGNFFIDSTVPASKTPLMQTVDIYGKVGAVALLEAGADPEHIRTESGDSYLDLISKSNGFFSDVLLVRRILHAKVLRELKLKVPEQ